MLTNLYSFQFNGLTFGAGTPFAVLSVDGLESLPELRVQDDNRGFNDGMFTGRDFLSGRHLTFVIQTFASAGMSANDNFDLLQQALNFQQSGVGTLNFQLSASDSNQFISARVRARQTTINPEYTFGFIRTQIQFFAPDPRYYNATQQSIALVPPAITGRTYNKIFNRSYGSVTNPTITGTINNTGWANTSPLITVYGPATLPVITNQNTGQFLQYNGILSATDVLVFDLNAQTISLNGVGVRNLLASGSQWWSAAPGSTTVAFTALGATSATQATISWYSAFV